MKVQNYSELICLCKYSVFPEEKLEIHLISEVLRQNSEFNNPSNELIDNSSLLIVNLDVLFLLKV